MSFKTRVSSRNCPTGIREDIAEKQGTEKAKSWPLGDNWLREHAEKFHDPKGSRKSGIFFLKGLKDPEVATQVKRLLETPGNRQLMAKRHRISVHFECPNGECIAVIAVNDYILEQEKIQLKKILAARETHSGDAATMIEQTTGVAVGQMATA